MAKRPRVLYHFTCRTWWHFIRSEGITRGECPISLKRTLQYPNLTTNADPAAQGWADARTDGSDKLAVRIAVRMPLSDTALIRWEDIARQHGMPTRDYLSLKRSGGGRPQDWWIYKGTVHPRRFESVDFLDGDQIHPTDRKMLARIEAGGFRTFAEFRDAAGEWVRPADGYDPVLTFPIG